MLSKDPTRSQYLGKDGDEEDSRSEEQVAREVLGVTPDDPDYMRRVEELIETLFQDMEDPNVPPGESSS